VTLAAVGDHGLVRVSSRGATDITAKYAVAIGPRLGAVADGDDGSADPTPGTMEVFGKDIFIGADNFRQARIAIKDRRQVKPSPEPREVTSAAAALVGAIANGDADGIAEARRETVRVVTSPVWEQNNQVATETITLSANQTVTIKSGSVEITIQNGHILINDGFKAGNASWVQASAPDGPVWVLGNASPTGVTPLPGMTRIPVDPRTAATPHSSRR
jgi:hypothetical protein